MNRTLTEGDLDAIVERWKAAGMICPLDEAGKKSAMSWYALVNDLGNGDASEGVRSLRKDMEFLRSARERKNIITGIAITMATISFFGWLGKIFWDTVFNK